MQATGSVIYFPKQSKPTRGSKKRKAEEKCTVLEWIRNTYDSCSDSWGKKAGVDVHETTSSKP
jgi:hypothetical protein